MDLYRPRDRDAARVRLGLDQSAPLIGTTGRLVPVKSHTTLIDALAALRRSHAGTALAAAQLLIVGDGPEREALTARAAGHGLASAVRLIGHRDDLPEILPAFDVYALPSLNEGLPRGVLEAQAAGLPVVASDVGALAQALCPISGRRVPAGDAEKLAAALAASLSDPIDAAIPRAFVAERFALTTTLAAFADILKL
jgi:glycosyltransferase involved in cell wall biosynthesis